MHPPIEFILLGIILFALCSANHVARERAQMHSREKRLISSVEDDSILPNDEAEDVVGDDVINSDKREDNDDEEEEEEEEIETAEVVIKLRSGGNGGALIDQAVSGDVVADSDIAHLLEGMFVEHDGHEETPDIDTSNSGKTKGDLHDYHVLTHQQKVQDGIESELPDEMKKMRRKKRNFIASDYILWPQGIVPYVIDASLNANSQKKIEEAIAIMSNLTCVQFTPRFSSLATSAVGNDHYVTFQDGPVCSSYVGILLQQESQAINLNEEYCINIDTIIHEMCHALGQEHEQSRYDRDNYVEMMWDNILDGRNNRNMVKMPTRDAYPYDLGSVLQYNLYALALDKSKPTIRVLDPKLAFLADTSNGLMYYDVKEITTAYKCTASCSNPIQCENGGFLNHRCECNCPAGLTGSDCTQIENANGCSGIIDLKDGESREIKTPNYPTNYNNAVCRWLIRGPTGKRIQMDIMDMQLPDNGKACYHWLEVRYNLLGQRGPELCGSRSGESYKTTKDELSSHMLLTFNSAFASDVAAQKGFRLNVKVIGMGCLNTPCVLGTCSEVADGDFSCACIPGVTGKKCDNIEADATVAANFDGDLPFIFNDKSKNDTFDWFLISGRTPTDNTGPSNAHGGIYYVYAEMSYPRVNGDIAWASSSYVTFTAADRCLEFYYHMYGDSIGATLNLYTEGTSTSPSVIWTKSGNQGNAWLKAEVSIPSMAGLKLTFEAVRLSSSQADIGLDSILLKPGLCGTFQTTTSSTTPLPTTAEPTTASPTTPRPAPVTCSFETGESCFLSNLGQLAATKRFGDLSGDNFDWTLGKQGRTPSRRTGPNSASQGSKYAFIEASRPRRRNDRAILQSTTSFDGSSIHCMTFDYHMYGSRVGSLNVYTRSSTGTQFLIFKKTGNKGNKWFSAVVQIPPTQGLQIFIEGVRGRSYRGDIALDNVAVKTGTCGCASNPCQNGGTCNTAANTNGYTCTCVSGFGGDTCNVIAGSVKCTFTKGSSCFLRQSKKDNNNWRFGRRTPSPRTGPQRPLDGTFAYMEASRRRRGRTCVFTSEGTSLANQNWCLLMDYHMYGRKMGSLVIRSGTAGATSEKWRKSGNQGNRWLKTKINIPGAQNLVVEIEGVRGKGFTSDIAIDNVQLTPGTC